MDAMGGSSYSIGSGYSRSDRFSTIKSNTKKYQKIWSNSLKRIIHSGEHPLGEHPLWEHPLWEHPLWEHPLGDSLSLLSTFNYCLLG